MRYRKLRIIWTVFYGIACVLLTALWVRSYSWADGATVPLGTQKTFSVCSTAGRLFVETYPNNPIIISKGSTVATISYPTGWSKCTIAEPPGASSDQFFDCNNVNGHLEVMFPHWLALLLGATLVGLSAIPRPYRFSLRTLLLATTLAAVVLGLAVYAARK